MKHLPLAGLAVLITGCSGLSQLQDTVAKYDQGAHSVAAGEMAYFREVQAADCANSFYSAAFSFASAASESLDLSGNCVPTIFDDQMIARRQALMDSLTLYVDKLQALATGDNNKQLDANSQQLAAQLNAMAKAHSLTSDLGIAHDVETAVIAIAEMALDQRRFKDTQQAAKTLETQVITLANILELENTAMSAGLASKVEQIEIQLHAAVLKARRDEGERSVLDVITARDIARSINPLGISAVSATVAARNPNVDPQNVVKQLNASLDSLVNANSAIATAGTGGVVAAVNDLIARAQHANSVLSSISK
jgi:hypothetical protein